MGQCKRKVINNPVVKYEINVPNIAKDKMAECRNLLVNSENHASALAVGMGYRLHFDLSEMLSLLENN